MRFVKESRIPAPPAQVFAWHETPGALEQLTPPWEHVTRIDSPGTITPGSRVVIHTRIGPMPIEWVAVHTEYDPPHLFADRQESGPFASWYHRHRFLDDGAGGTLMRDEVDYEPPLGWLGRLFSGPFVQQKLERMFNFRHEVVARLAAAGELGPAP